MCPSAVGVSGRSCPPAFPDYAPCDRSIPFATEQDVRCGKSAPRAPTGQRGWRRRRENGPSPHARGRFRRCRRIRQPDRCAWRGDSSVSVNPREPAGWRVIQTPASAPASCRGGARTRGPDPHTTSLQGAPGALPEAISSPLNGSPWGQRAEPRSEPHLITSVAQSTLYSQVVRTTRRSVRPRATSSSLA